MMCELRQDHLDQISERTGRLARTMQVRDLAGMSIQNVLKNRVVMARLRKVLSTVNTAFPECVNKIVLMNVPSGFNLLWAALRPLINARIAEKVKFCDGAAYLQEVRDLLGIPGLEALVRARHQAPDGTIPAEGLEVIPGGKEYLCQRLTAGQEARWNFEVPRDTGALQFKVDFVP